MSPLPDPRRRREDSDPAEDPTGIRSLLAGLGDPGPMPEDLSLRITAALADERTRQDAARHEVVVLSEHRERRRPRYRWVLPAAAAATLAVVGGGLLSGALSGGSSSTTAGSSLSATTTTAQESQADTPAGASSAAKSRDATGPSSLDPATRASGAEGVLVSFSNAAYTTRELATQAISVRAGTLAPIATMAAESPGVGPLATPAGARSCADALGVPTDTPVLVDLGTIDGKPGALVVVLRADGSATAYAVGRYCTQGAPSLIAGPVKVA